jgi:hypothetical protein
MTVCTSVQVHAGLPFPFLWLTLRFVTSSDQQILTGQIMTLDKPATVTQLILLTAIPHSPLSMEKPHTSLEPIRGKVFSEGTTPTIWLGRQLRTQPGPEGLHSAGNSCSEKSPFHDVSRMVSRHTHSPCPTNLLFITQCGFMVLLYFVCIHFGQIYLMAP